MKASSQPGRRFLRAAGISAWVLSGVPAVLMVLGRFEFEGETLYLSPAKFAIWAGAALAFGAAFWVTSGDAGAERPRRSSVVLLAVQSVAALAMYELVCTGLETMLLVVVAAQLGLFVRLLIGAPWVLLQTCLLAWLGVAHWGVFRSVGWALLIALPVEVLAMFTSYFAASQARARHALGRTIAELEATREILAESREMAERARISRELHDLLGHHLTALSLSLEAARHRAEGAARKQIERSQELAKMLLTDVREAVRSIRGGATVDMVRVLAPLLADIARPRVHLDVPQGLSVSDPERAQALVRCVQEIITNAVRHARAENLWIEISEDEAGIRVEGRDDGQGAPSIRPGRGLTGMRERLTRLGGSVEYDSPTDGGFTVRALIPLVEPAR
jgi:signal transduction histidine kinase